MADLISRDYVLAEYDRQHKGPPGGARKIMEEAPAVDAAPVEATAKRLQRAFFSDNWEAWAEWLRGNYSDEDFVAHVDGKKDAIPLEWLRHRLTMAQKHGSAHPEQAIRYVLWLWEQQKDG